MTRRASLAALALLHAGLVTLPGAEARASASIVPRASGLDIPVGLANAGDGSNRLFIVEQEGCIRYFAGKVAGARCGQAGTRFLDIRGRVTGACPGGCQGGLIGLAFHPDYGTNGFFFVLYSSVANPAPPARNAGDIVIARYIVTADPDLADPASERILLVVPHPEPWHLAGHMAFGPDGYLYATIGDPDAYAQDTADRRGKILRIDVDEPNPPYYRIPPTNPFPSGGPGTCGPLFPGSPCDEIWGYGLRNPWRFSFDRETGDLYIADVGELAWEEINFQAVGAPGGRNYGWNVLEGGLHGSQPVPNGNCYRDVPPGSCAAFINGGSTLPVLEYDHDTGFSITGGYVYRGPVTSDVWTGSYVFADYIGGDMWRGFRDGGGSWVMEVMFTGLPFITTFGEDDAGNLYFTRESALFQIVMESALPVPPGASSFGAARVRAVTGDARRRR